MEGAFAWIGQLVEWLGSLIPRITIVRATHGGVRFRRGKYVQEMKPGIHVYWPFLTEIEVVPVARQTHNLPNQTLTTKDNQQICISAIVVYEIKDVVAALSKNWDYNDTISDVTLSAVAQVILERTYDELMANITILQKHLTKEARGRLRPFGIRVRKALLTDFAPCYVLRTVGDQGAPVPFSRSL